MIQLHGGRSLTRPECLAAFCSASRQEKYAAQEQAAVDAIETLVHLSQGIYPRLLADRGLVSALEVAVGNSPVPVTVISRDVGRYSSPVEAAAYFCCLEAVQNAAKHAGARPSA